MTEPLSEDELAGLKALRELAETLPPYDWQWTTLTGENGPYQSHEDMIEGIAKTIRHSESLGLHAITWNDEDVDGRSSVVCTTGNGPTSPLHAQYIAAVKPSNILRLLAHIAALTEERDGLKEGWQPISELPPLMQRPSRHFIVVEGWRDHSGAHWARKHWGLAYVRTGEDSIFEYRKEDIMQLAKDGDMELYSLSVTHWRPANIPSGRYPLLKNEIEQGCSGNG